MTLARFFENLLKFVPRGRNARKIVAIYSIVAATARFGLANTIFTSSKTNIVPEFHYGVLYTALFIFLVFTIDTRRFTKLGFVVSVLGSSLFVLQAFDMWPSYPSSVYYAFMGTILMFESITIWQFINVNK